MKKKILFLLRVIVAFILIQTLFFKFTAAPESKYVFSSLGVEPWGRVFTGILELFASLLLLIPSTQIIGAIFTIMIMGGAILSHLFILGIVVQNDGGLLFSLACFTFISSILIVSLQFELTQSALKNILGLHHEQNK